MNKNLDLHISGMGCNACSTKIEKTLGALKGVSKASVDLVHEEAHIEFNTEQISIEDLKFAVKEAGYEATEKGRVTTMVMDIEGMSCQHCVNTVNESFNKLPGTREVSIVLEDGRAWISYDTSLNNPEDYVKAVEAAGYKVLESGQEKSAEKKS